MRAGLRLCCKPLKNKKDMNKIKLKKIKVRNNQVLTTADKYEDEVYLDKKGLLLDAKNNKGVLKLYQRVVDVGPMVRDIAPGNMVAINPTAYMKRHLRDQNNSLRADIPENHIKEEYGPDYEIPIIELDDVEHLMLYDRDIDFIILDAEGIS